MVARGFTTTLIALFIFLISIPGYSLAASEHAGHDGSPTNSQSREEAIIHQQHESGQGEHDQTGSDHSQGSSSHEEQGGGHGNSGTGELEPVKNLLVGGFAGIDALIIGIALYMKRRLQGGVTG